MRKPRRVRGTGHVSSMGGMGNILRRICSMQEWLIHRNSRCYVIHSRNNRTTTLCNPFLGNGSVNTLPRRQWGHTTVDSDDVTFYVGPRRRFIGDNKGHLRAVVSWRS
jgi:hypothetical protein